MTGCWKSHVFRQQLLPHGDDGDHADVRRRDDRVDAGKPHRVRRIDATDASVRDGAAQDCGMQRGTTLHIVYKFAAAAQKAQILDALDRAADQTVAGWFVR